MRNHLKQWEIQVRASTEACEDAFRGSFDRKSGNLLKRAHWTLGQDSDENGPHVTAVLGGWAGLGKVYASLENTGTAGEREEASRGSAIGFSVEPGNTDDSSFCVMWLKDFNSGLMGTAGGGVIKNYMKVVESNLRHLDPKLSVVKR